MARSGRQAHRITPTVRRRSRTTDRRGPDVVLSNHREWFQLQVVARRPAVSRKPSPPRRLLVHATLSWIGRRALLVTAVLLGISPLAPAQATPPQLSVAAPAAKSAQSGAEVVAVRQVADRLTDLTVRVAGSRRPHRERPAAHAGRLESGRSPSALADVLVAARLLRGTTRRGPAPTSRTIPSLRKVLVVMPEAGWNGWYSDWWNYGAGGDPALGDVPHRRAHAPAGTRLGAQARIVSWPASRWAAREPCCYAARHPGMFRAAAA